MWGTLYEWSKKPGNWMIAIMILVAGVTVMGYMGAPIPKPAWASDVNRVESTLIGFTTQYYQRSLRGYEDRIIDLEIQKRQAPEGSKDIYDKAIGNTKRQIREDEYQLKLYRDRGEKLK